MTEEELFDWVADRLPAEVDRDEERVSAIAEGYEHGITGLLDSAAMYGPIPPEVVDKIRSEYAPDSSIREILDYLLTLQ